MSNVIKEMKNIELINIIKNTCIYDILQLNKTESELIIEVLNRFENLTIKNIENAKKYHNANREKHNSQKLNYYHQHKDEINKKRREKYQANKGIK